MTLRLVASGDDRALAIRDHLVPLVRRLGRIEVQQGALRLIAHRPAGWDFEHWTPFNDLAPGEAASPGYRHALGRQRGVPDLPYGLDAWRGGTKVLSILWADDGSVEVATFLRGPWEDQALSL